MNSVNGPKQSRLTERYLNTLDPELHPGDMYHGDFRSHYDAAQWMGSQEKVKDRKYNIEEYTLPSTLI